MSSRLQEMVKRGLVTPPPFLPTNIHYEVLMGSHAYGMNTDTSDMDIQGFCIPPKDDLFPHLRGEINGFGTHLPRFEEYSQHHIFDKSVNPVQEYDFTFFSIVKFFQLVMQCNPNMIDILFVPENCVLHITRIGIMVREKRKIFLHKGAFHRFKGYSYQQVHKMQLREATGNRKEIIERFGYDVKFGSHVLRLLGEIEQIMMEGDLDLQRNREQLKSVRRGEWTKESIIKYFEEKEKSLEELYLKSPLPHGPDEPAIKALLLSCLEEHYGNLDTCLKTVEPSVQALREIQAILNRVKI